MTKVVVGSKFPTTNSGDIVVVEYYNSAKVKVKFLDTGTEKFCEAGDIRKGSIRDPEALCFKVPEGLVLKSLKYGYFEIIKDEGANDVHIKFTETGHCTKVSRSHIKLRCIKDPLLPFIHGVGYIGVGNYISRINGKRPQAYHKWKSMLDRCYGTRCGVKYANYRDGKVTVTESWHNYQNFAEWYESNAIEGWDLDKDLKGNSNIYSPESCVFLPPSINKALIRGRSDRAIPTGVVLRSHGYDVSLGIGGGRTTYIGTFNCPEKAFYAYREVKGDYIKSLAEQYEDVLSEEVYSLLKNFQVEDNSSYPWGKPL